MAVDLRTFARIGFVVVSVSLLVTHSLALTQSALERESLIDVPGAAVVIEKLDADAEHDGLLTADIQTDVELTLRLAGFRVFSTEELQNRVPVLYVTVTTKADGAGGGLSAVSIALRLMQDVTLATGQHLPAPTWYAESVALGGRDKLRTFVRDSVQDKVTRFLNDWLTVNPKRQ